MFARNPIFPAANPRRAFCIILGISAAMVTTQALAGQVTSGNNNTSLTLSGQVNRGLLWYDDGTGGERIYVDNSNASTRFLLVGKGNLNRDVTIGTQIEIGAVSNPSDGVGGGLDARKTELYFDHKRYGKLWLGLGDTASNGTSEVDLSGTTVVANSDIADTAGNIVFVGGGTDIAGAYDNFDGLGALGREDRIRYDSPTINNFVLSASHVTTDVWDVAVRYSGNLGGGIQVAAAGGYVNDGPGNTAINGSVSALYKSGLSLTGAIGQDQSAGATESFWYAKAGYIKGNSAYSVDMTEATDISGAGEVATSFGVAYVRKYNSAGTELYAGLRSHSLDDGTNNPPDDIMTMLAGARVKF